MKKWFAVPAVALFMGVLFSPCTPQAATPAAPAAKNAATAKAAQPHPGGTWKVLIKNQAVRFGYPPMIIGQDRDFAPPFFNHLIGIGDDGNYKPELASSWETSADGKAITFKLRQGVKFHDGTAFNAQAVKANLDKLIPPNPVILNGIASVEALDEYTVRIHLTDSNNLILYQIASHYACFMYSPTALQKNGADWAVTHPVGTGPFVLKEYQPNISITYAKNPNYWEKGLPHLDAMEMKTVSDPMNQVITIKAGQANAIYDAAPAAAAQLRDGGYPLLVAPGSLHVLVFDAKNSEYFAKPQVRQAIEYAIDKEAICSGPGMGLYQPLYQIVPTKSPDYNPACPPRRYNVAKAKQLLKDAGYPSGFSFKAYFQDNTWKDGLVAVQSYLFQVGINMEINYISSAAYATIRSSGKIDRGAVTVAPMEALSNKLYVMDTYFRSNANIYQFMTRPAGTDALINQAKLARDLASASKITKQITKLVYDDETVVPMWVAPRSVVLDKSVHDPGWFIAGDSANNKFGTKTWLAK